MNILITGVAGFIGSSTARELLKKDNCNIIGIDNFNDYYNPKFKEENIKDLKIKLYRCDITDKNILNIKTPYELKEHIQEGLSLIKN